MMTKAELQEKIRSLENELNKFKKIANQKKSEDLLKYKSFVEKIFNSNPNPLYIFDLQAQKTIFQSKPAGEILGYSHKKINNLGNNIIKKIIHSDDLPRLHKHFEEIASSEENKIFSIEYRIKMKDGSYRWFLSRDAVFQRDENGKVKEIIGTAQDISDLKKSQEKYRSNEALLKTVFENIPFDLWVCDPDGKYVMQNSTSIRHWGDQKGKTPDQLKLPSRIKKSWKTNNRKALQGKIVKEDVKYNHGNEEREYHKIISSINDENRVIGVLGVNIDITERKKAENSLLEMQLHLRTLLDNLLDAVLLVNDQEEIIFANKEFYKLFKINEKDPQIKDKNYLKTKAHSIIKNAEEFLSKTEQIVRENKVKKNDKFELKNGRIYERRFTPIISGKKTNGYLWQYRDITERINTNKSLKISEQRFELALNGANIGLWDWDIPSGNVTVNDVWAKMLGYKLRDIKTNFAAWKKLIHPDDYETVMQRLNEHLEGKTSWYESEHRLRAKNGQWKWILDKGKIFVWDEKGNPIRALGTHFDVTYRKIAEHSLKESEELFRTAFETAPMGVLFVNPSGKIIKANHNIAVMLDFSIKELIDMPFKKLAHPDEHKLLFELKEQKVNEKSSFEKRYFCKNGSYIWASVSMASLYDHLNNWQYNVVFVDDITIDKTAKIEKHKLEMQLRQAQKLETIGTLAGGIAHDFNNILGPIFGYTEMALSHIKKNPELEESLKNVLMAATRAKDLVNQILLFSRQAEEEKKPLKIQYILKETLKFLKSSLPVTITFKENIDKNCPAVMADSTQIHQVITNLCTNAYQAMRKHGGTLSVELKPFIVDKGFIKNNREFKEGNYVRLTVKDSGHGMDQSILNRIFEPFFTTKQVGEGTGLGLSVVHGIVTKHNGYIKVESEKGKGSVFEIYLPALEEKSVESVSRLGKLPKGKENILCIDDQAEIANVLKSLLSDLGYSVDAFTDSLNAYETFKSNPEKYDLIITDQTMPKLSGIQLSKYILKSKPDIPIILITGFSEEVSELTISETGIHKVIMKPFTAMDIAQSIRNAIDNKN